jgi:hypothetical protein
VQRAIEDMKTASDVEKVVAELEEKEKHYDDYEQLHLEYDEEHQEEVYSLISNGIHIALDIVRNGGKE